MELVLHFANEDGSDDEVIFWPEKSADVKLTMEYATWVNLGRTSRYVLED